MKECKTWGLLFVTAVTWTTVLQEKGYSGGGAPGSCGVFRKQNLERKQRHFVFKNLTDRRETQV